MFSAMDILAASFKPKKAAIKTAMLIKIGQSNAACHPLAANLNDDTPSIEISIPARDCPKVFARITPKINEIAKMKAKRTTYCLLMSEVLNPNAFRAAIECLSFAINILRNSNVMSKVSKTAIITPA